MSKLPVSFIVDCEVRFKNGNDLFKEFFVEKNDNYYARIDKLVYIRDENNNPIGVIVLHNGYCGWSLCCEKDKWDKSFGIYKAICKLGSKKNIKEISNEVGQSISLSTKPYFIKMKRLYLKLREIIEYEEREK